MDATRLSRITPRILASAVPGTSPRWWERKMQRLLELRDEDGRAIITKVDRRYLGDLGKLVDVILAGGLDSRGSEAA